MSVDLYQPFTNRITGETFRCLSSAPEAYVTEWVVEPGGYVPFEHVHLAQDEVFHVKEGELRAVIQGREHILGAGQTITMPRGTRQIAYNNKPEVLRCVLEYRPGLDSYAVFQCFGGLTLDRDMDRRGLINFAKMMYFMEKMGAKAIARPAFVPTVVFRLFMKLFYLVGAALGWERMYRRYTG